MNAGDIRALSASDLKKRIDDTYKELFNLRFRHGTRQLENTTELNKVRKDIARLKTIQRERELQASVTGKA